MKEINAKLSLLKRISAFSKRIFHKPVEGDRRTAEEQNPELSSSSTPASPADNGLSSVYLEQYPHDVPASILPSGWHWVDYDDGSGHLQSPAGEKYFSYDRAPYANQGGIEYKEWAQDWYGPFWGTFSDFKSYAESVVGRKYLHEIHESKSSDKSSVAAHQPDMTRDALQQNGLSLGEHDISAIMTQVANNAWFGREPTTVYLRAGTHTIEVSGYLYEPGYEDFSSTASISLDGTVLYGMDSRNVDAYHNETYQTGLYKTPEEAISHIRNLIRDERVQLCVSEKTDLSDQIQTAHSSTESIRSFSAREQPAIALER